MTSPILIVQVHTPETEPRLAVLPLPATIGRDPLCDLELVDPRVSAHHATIGPDSDGYVIRDAGSANGIWSTETRAQEFPFNPDQPVRVGQTTLELVLATDEQSRVIRIYHDRRPTRDPDRVIRLPSYVGIDEEGRLAFDEVSVVTGRGVILPDGDGVRLLRAGGVSLDKADLDEAGHLVVGDYRIEVVRFGESVSFATDLTFDESGHLLRLQDTRPDKVDFPPACFGAKRVSLSDLEEASVPLMESRFLALGAGLGSFCWVDILRVHSVSAEDILAVGIEGTPYARYARLCRHSQIPLKERLRSNSESCPDNYWGFPGYGLREAWGAFKRARLISATRTAWKLFAEPDYTDTYTPRADDVFRAIDKEAERIGWSSMFHKGRIRAIRQTTDGRFAVAVSSRAQSDAPHAIYLAPTLHLALGYPGVQFLPDLREYRERTRDFERVVNAYEDHDRLYERLERDGGTVILRGRGIVASRVLQRLFEARKAGGDVQIVHLMRGPKTSGSQSGKAKRVVEHHWEFQPFNWPEACWGGDLREVLEDSKASDREELLELWGGTTTASRRDWRRIVSEGLKRGWYRIEFATVDHIDGGEKGLEVSLTGQSRDRKLSCDSIIDATGLVSSLQVNPVLADLIETYELDLNAQGRLEVAETFEVERLRNDGGRVFVAGVCALGGFYAPVDSFLGLQYAADASLDAIRPAIRRLGAVRSFGAWLRWARGAEP